MAEPAKSGGMFRSLRFRNARLYFLGLLVSNVGTWIQFTATSYLLYDLRGNATTTLCLSNDVLADCGLTR